MNIESKIIAFIKDDLEFSQQRNSSFSLRAYSKKLGVSHTSLSKLFTGKRKLTLQTAEKILSKIAGPKDFSTLMSELNSKIQGEKDKTYSAHYKEYKENKYSQIDWFHFAIHGLLRTPSCNGTIEEISKRLDLTKSKVTKALDLLIELEIVSKKGKKYSAAVNNFSIKVDHNNPLTSILFRETLTNNVKLGLEKFENAPREKSSLSSIYLPINVNKIDEARTMIRQFRREMGKFLVDGKMDEVYLLNVQLVPITDISQESED